MSKMVACIPVRNEEHVLEQFFKSLFDFVDEAVVVDDGSTDSTPLIIQKYHKNIKMVHTNPQGTRPFNNGLESSNRNRLLEMARLLQADWVLQIDSDEFLQDTFKNEIPLLLKRGCSTKLQIVNIWDLDQEGNLRFRVDGEHGCFYRYRLYRLLPRLRFSPQPLIATPKAFDRKNRYKCEKVKIVHFGWCQDSRIKHLKQYYEVYKMQNLKNVISFEEFQNNSEIQNNMRIVEQDNHSIKLATWHQVFGDTKEQDKYTRIYNEIQKYWKDKGSL